MARTPVKSSDDLEEHGRRKSLIVNPDRAIELRRVDIIRRRLRGETISSIASSLGCSVSTVNNDLKVIRDANNSVVKDFNQEDYIGDTLQTFKKIEEESWMQVFALDTGDSRKAKFLDSIRATRKEAVKLLQSSGLLHKEAQKVEIQVTSEVINGWSSDQKMLVADAVIEAAIIDVDVVEAQPEFDSLPNKNEDVNFEDLATFMDE
jgi:hypothetical protein